MQLFTIRRLRVVGFVAAAALGASLSQATYATSANATAHINQITTVDPAIYPTALNSFTLQGVILSITSNSLCASQAQSYGPALTLFEIKDDQHGQQMYATLLAAALAGSAVTVAVDDAFVDSNGACFVKRISIQGT